MRHDAIQMQINFVVPLIQASGNVMWFHTFFLILIWADSWGVGRAVAITSIQNGGCVKDCICTQNRIHQPKAYVHRNTKYRHRYRYRCQYLCIFSLHHLAEYLIEACSNNLLSIGSNHRTESGIALAFTAHTESCTQRLAIQVIANRDSCSVARNWGGLLTIIRVDNAP